MAQVASTSPLAGGQRVSINEASLSTSPLAGGQHISINDPSLSICPRAGGKQALNVLTAELAGIASTSPLAAKKKLDPDSIKVFAYRA